MKTFEVRRTYTHKDAPGVTYTAHVHGDTIKITRETAGESVTDEYDWISTPALDHLTKLSDAGWEIQPECNSEEHPEYED